MLKKLRLKFILINMCIVVAMLLVIFATVYHFTKSDLDNQADAMFQTISQNMRQPGSRFEPGKKAQLPHFVLQINRLGEIYASGYTYHDLTDETFLQDLVKQVYHAGSQDGKIPEYALRYHWDQSISGLQTIMFVDISSQNAALTALVQGSVLIGIASVLVFLLISIILAFWAVKPVEKAWAQQRQFVSDASHELKTPLSVIMSNAELLQDPDYDPQSKVQFADSIVTMSYRMRELVEGLLELARADNGQTQKSFQRLALSQLVEEALLPFEPVLYEKQLTLESSIEQGIFLTGSAAHLQQVLGILLDNAGKYATPGVITVKLQRQSRNSCLLSVANPGEPIPETELEKIFDRFYRADTARTGNGSFGLGLSIAKSIVDNHKGKIWAQSNQTGNCFYVQLPIG